MTPARCARCVLGTLRAMAHSLGSLAVGAAPERVAAPRFRQRMFSRPHPQNIHTRARCTNSPERAPTIISHFATSCSSSSVVAPRPGRRPADATSAGMSAGNRSCMPTPGHARSPDRRVRTGCPEFVWRSDRLPLRNMSISGSTKFRRVFVAAGEPLLRCV